MVGLYESLDNSFGNVFDGEFSGKDRRNGE